MLTPSARLAAAIAASVSPCFTVYFADFVGAEADSFARVTFGLEFELEFELEFAVDFEVDVDVELAFDVVFGFGPEVFDGTSTAGAVLVSVTTPAFSFRTPPF